MTNRGFGPDDATGTLDDFKAAMDADDNVFWRMECGHHLNLLEDAIDRLDAVRKAVDGVWHDRCGPFRGIMCETCNALTDLCDALGIDPPPPRWEEQ